MSAFSDSCHLYCGNHNSSSCLKGFQLCFCSPLQSLELIGPAWKRRWHGQLSGPPEENTRNTSLHFTIPWHYRKFTPCKISRSARWRAVIKNPTHYGVQCIASFSHGGLTHRFPVLRLKMPLTTGFAFSLFDEIYRRFQTKRKKITTAGSCLPALLPSSQGTSAVQHLTFLWKNRLLGSDLQNINLPDIWDFSLWSDGTIARQRLHNLQVQFHDFHQPGYVAGNFVYPSILPQFTAGEAFPQ